MLETCARLWSKLIPRRTLQSLLRSNRARIRYATSWSARAHHPRLAVLNSRNP